MKDFSSSQLRSEIVEVLTEKGIMIPTEIQRQTIPILLAHSGDFVGRSATGTGKTIAYGAPLLSRIDPESGTVQGIVLVPTRELCEQVGNELTELGAKIPDLKVAVIYGGMPVKVQTQALSQGVQIIVATPGRLVDLIGRKVVYLSSVNFVVFDEADEMLLKGFQTDIDKILATSKRNYASWLFSATLPDEVNVLIKKYLNKELQKVRLGKKIQTNTGISHQYVELVPEDKLDALLHYLRRYGDQKGIIFCRTKSGVQKLYKQLSAHKFSSGAIHGDLPQGLRNKVMTQFREGNIQFLIATDVASRGLDVAEISFVMQYHVADTKDSYTHRSGRTSRMGAQGTCLTFVFPEEKDKLFDFAKYLNFSLESLPVPGFKEQLINKALLWGRKVAKEKPLGDTWTQATRDDFKKELAHLSKDELLEKLLASYLRDAAR